MFWLIKIVLILCIICATVSKIRQVLGWRGKPLTKTPELRETPCDYMEIACDPQEIACPPEIPNDQSETPNDSPETLTEFKGATGMVELDNSPLIKNTQSGFLDSIS